MCEEKPYNLNDLKQIQSEFFDYHIRDKLKQTVVNDRFLEKFDNCDTSILNFFHNKNVLITGSSGFMGKILLEKLLRSCTGISTVYLLMREKKGVAQEARLEKMLNNTAFDRLRKESPEMLKKVKIICGNCESINLGISETDRTLLKEHVNIVFHVAASVRFDDPLKKAVLMNTRGSRDAVYLAKEMLHLDVFIHVSTSYANTYNKTVVDEIIYPSNVDWRLIIQMAENMDDATMNTLQAKILENYPNTYTFTKALSEDIMNEESGNMPVVIFRPSIVTGSYAEPVPGWIDNFNGPASILIGGGLGILHAINIDENVTPDWVEVDIAINAMIISACYQSINFQNGNKKCLIINACTSNIKPVSYNSLVENSLKLGKLYPLSSMMWYPFILLIKNKYLYNMCVVLFHIIPGLLIDILLHFKGEKLSLMKIYRKAYFSNKALIYFMTNEWRFKNGHFLSLQDILSEKEREIFPTDFYTHNEILEMTEGLFGYKKCLLHEEISPKKLKQSKIKMQRLFILHCVLIGTIFGCVLTIILWFGQNKLQSEIF